MSMSAVLGSHLVPVGVAVKNPPAMTSFGVTNSAPWRGSTTGYGGGGGGLVIECARQGHRRRQLRTTGRLDHAKRSRGTLNASPLYAPLPPLPAECTLVSSADEAASASASSPEEPSSAE